ncbi:MAG: hypothetical protein H7Y02_06615 [Candidatus Obscuribacterales bacterium]|nr:hypothetical protein [Steroidobacteraceae bacterium]
MVNACRDGQYSPLIKRMSSGWAVMGESQFLKGYCLLLPDPVVPHLNAMDFSVRDKFLSDMGKLGDATLAATGALRINYAMFGNVEPALHAHVIPRYTTEEPTMRTAHPWMYDWSAAPQFDVQLHGPLLAAIRDRLS